jgi:(2Fe-2S) ferredoxin
VMVVYPEGIWYTAIDQSDIDEIIDTHFVKGQVVDRLRID